MNMPDFDRLVEQGKTYAAETKATNSKRVEETMLGTDRGKREVCKAGGCGVSVMLPSRFPDGLCDFHRTAPGSVDKPNVLRQAAGLIYGERAATYGPADENMGAIIRMFNAWLDIRYLNHDSVDLDSFDAVMFNVCIKTCRLAHSLRKDPLAPHMDSVVDAAGYFGLIGKIVEERAAKRAGR